MFKRKDSKLYERGNWLSQFGLYRYENENNRMKNRRSIVGIYGLLAMLTIVIVVIFLLICNEINSERVKQIPTIESISNKTDIRLITTWPTTLSKENQENSIIDKSYDTVHIITTSNISEENSEDLPDLDMSASDEQPSLSMEYRSPYGINSHPISSIIPSNHRPSRKQFSVARPFEYILSGTPPTSFHIPSNDTLDSHSISFPQIPKDYVGNVKSIQDILQKVNADNDFIVPSSSSSISGDKKIRFGGTYRHRKDSSFADIFDQAKKQHYSGTYILPSASSLKPLTENSIKNDPFYLYKPQQPSDINLLATHEFRFAPPIRYSTPKPLFSKPAGYYSTGNKLFNPYTNGQEVSSLYQQIIAANLAHNLKNHKDESRRSEVNQKPFSLMLDVYPMTDDDQSTTSRPYLKYRSPYFTTSNVYTPNLSAAGVNHSPSHYYLENPSIYHSFPPQPINKQRLLEAQHFYNQMYLSKLQKTKNSFNPYYHRSPAQSQPPAITASESNTPSQITVHLNLFPKNKNHITSKTRNVEILSRNEEPFVSGDDVLSSGNENKANNAYSNGKIIEVATIKPTQLIKSTTTTENPLKKMLKLEMVPSSFPAAAQQNQSNVNQLLEIEKTSGLGDHHCDTVKCRNENYQFYNQLHSTTTQTAPIMLVESSTLHERAYEIDDDQQLLSESINQYDQGLVTERLSTPIPTIIPIEPRSFFEEDDYSNSSS